MSDPKTIVINLKILGSIDTGTKLNTREKYFTLDQVTWYQGIRRFYRRDDRGVTYEKISLLIRNVQDLLQNQYDGPRSLGLENKDDLRSYLTPILEDAQRGLRSLQITYEDDRTFTSQIEVEISTIDRLLLKDHRQNNQRQNFVKSFEKEKETSEKEIKIETKKETLEKPFEFGENSNENIKGTTFENILTSDDFPSDTYKRPRLTMNKLPTKLASSMHYLQNKQRIDSLKNNKKDKDDVTNRNNDVTNRNNDVTNRNKDDDDII